MVKQYRNKKRTQEQLNDILSFSHFPRPLGLHRREDVARCGTSVLIYLLYITHHTPGNLFFTVTPNSNVTIKTLRTFPLVIRINATHTIA